MITVVAPPELRKLLNRSRLKFDIYNPIPFSGFGYKTRIDARKDAISFINKHKNKMILNTTKITQHSKPKYCNSYTRNGITTYKSWMQTWAWVLEAFTEGKTE
jgi:hypothetical protein